ncbi:hypothetical protein C8J56DRAFT_780451, partial [Mycena floridula]
MHFYYAIDKHAGHVVTDPSVREHLENLSTGTTKQQLGRLPLVIRMPVVITANFDIESGIVNGCVGTLQSLKFLEELNERRHATSCIVKSKDIIGEALTHLNKHEATVIEDEKDMLF